jgi:hypothetical protein
MTKPQSAAKKLGSIMKELMHRRLRRLLRRLLVSLLIRLFVSLLRRLLVSRLWRRKSCKNLRRLSLLTLFRYRQPLSMLYYYYCSYYCYHNPTPTWCFPV